MFKCPKCGIQNLDDAKYCKECGSEIWYYQPIQKLPISEITVELLYNNISRVMKQYKLPDMIYKVLESAFIKYISDPIRWPMQFTLMYFKNCNMFDIFREFQIIISLGYYLAIAIEKTTGKILDVPLEIIHRLKVDCSAEWICDFSYKINSQGIEIIQDLFKEDDSLSRYFNNMFPVNDNIIEEVIVAYAEKSYKTFMSTKQLKKGSLSEYDQKLIFDVITSHIDWGLWIRFAERIAEIYRDTHYRR